MFHFDFSIKKFPKCAEIEDIQENIWRYTYENRFSDTKRKSKC